MATSSSPLSAAIFEETIFSTAQKKDPDPADWQHRTFQDFRDSSAILLEIAPVVTRNRDLPSEVMSALHPFKIETIYDACNKARNTANMSIRPLTLQLDLRCNLSSCRVCEV